MIEIASKLIEQYDPDNCGFNIWKETFGVATVGSLTYVLFTYPRYAKFFCSVLCVLIVFMLLFFILYIHFLRKQFLR